MWIVVALLVLIGPLSSRAGDTYLDRSKVREAVPYGASIEQRPSDGKTAPPSVPERARARPGSSAPASTIPDDRGRVPDQR